MKHALLLLLASIVIICANRPASSQDLHPGIIGEDDRVRLDQHGQPWDAVGQVNVASLRIIGQCTGTLVAPNLVVTAAHCVINPLNQKPFLFGDIHFLAGVRGAENKGHATAQCLHFLTNYQYIAPEKLTPTMPAQNVPKEFFTNDVVVIVLNNRIAVDPAPLDEGVIPQPGLRLTHVAYPADHRFVPWVHFDCHLLRSDLEVGMWLNDCDTHRGSSGGPLFTKADGKYKVAAIMVGTGGRIFNRAMPISKWLDLTRNTKCPLGAERDKRLALREGARVEAALRYRTVLRTIVAMLRPDRSAVGSLWRPWRPLHLGQRDSATDHKIFRLS